MICLSLIAQEVAWSNEKDNSVSEIKWQGKETHTNITYKHLWFVISHPNFKSNACSSTVHWMLKYTNNMREKHDVFTVIE